MAVRTSDAFANAIIDQSPNTALGSSAILRAKTGSRSTTFGNAAAGTILVSWNLGASPFAAATARAAALTSVPRTATASAGGTVGCVELLDSSNNIVADWNQGDGFTFAPALIEVSQSVDLNSLTITLPNPS